MTALLAQAGLKRVLELGGISKRLSGFSGPATATLVNVLGQAVLTKTLAGTAAGQPLLTRGLAAGVYTLRVTVAGQVLNRKAVLQ